MNTFTTLVTPLGGTAPSRTPPRPDGAPQAAGAGRTTHARAGIEAESLTDVQDETLKAMDSVCDALGGRVRRGDGVEAHVIPLPLDSEVLPRVAAAVAGAAMRTGAANRPVADLIGYSEPVATRVRLSHEERAHSAPAEPEACRG